MGTGIGVWLAKTQGNSLHSPSATPHDNQSKPCSAYFGMRKGRVALGLWRLSGENPTSGMASGGLLELGVVESGCWACLLALKASGTRSCGGSKPVSDGGDAPLGEGRWTPVPVEVVLLEAS